MVDFIGIERVQQLVARRGPARFMEELAGEIEADFLRWGEFDKSARHATHSPVGVIELMPACDGRLYSFKYVNGHPKNTAVGLLTVTAFGLLADVHTGYPLLLSELTLTTALRTAATSALAARSEEHTSELQSQSKLVCRLMLENKEQGIGVGSTPATGRTAAQRRTGHSNGAD